MKRLAFFGRANATPPALPKQTMKFNDIYCYPRCPVCRCSNRLGKRQTVFRNPSRNNFICIEGHSFST